MDRFRKLYAISALLCIGLGVALALAVIAGIWSEFSSPAISKIIGTIVVLFLLSGALHVVAKGMCEEPDSRTRD